MWFSAVVGVDGGDDWVFLIDQIVIIPTIRRLTGWWGKMWRELSLKKRKKNEGNVINAPLTKTLTIF